MIIVDGRQSEQKISNFANLEELLSNVMQEEQLAGRVITDVIVNDENFSEVYPHQAEDMSCANITKVEIRSEPADKMAVDMAAEMHKVATLMGNGARNISRLFRENKNSEALELLQDMLDVTRDFMGLITQLRNKYLGGADEELARKTDKLSDLLSEMSDVMENEDWVLLSDLLEYEFAPICDDLRVIGDKTHQQLQNVVAGK